MYMNYLEKLKEKGYKSIEDLQETFQEEFKEGSFTIYCIEENEVINLRLVESYMALEFKNDVDHHGFSEGVMNEVLKSDADPLLGTISDTSPLGAKLKDAINKEVIELHLNGNTVTYIVLNGGKVKKEKNVNKFYNKEIKNNVENGILKCPKCGAPLVLRNGKFGKFYGCSQFPKCWYTKKYSK